MIMDRTEKVRKLQELKKEIKRKELQIIEKQNELKILEEEYTQEETSELPILLFLIDETLPMPDEPRDFMYEYVYYCPDTDKKLYIDQHSEEVFLPNTIDLRDSFSTFNVPRKSFPATALDYSSEINLAISILKSQIDDIFRHDTIDSWAGLGASLKVAALEKQFSRDLKATKQN